ncbi:MAG: hypothetical protein GY898_17855 [Proteobacteria bacterium]|nr:hypothetical protein [Pseudomonadota bacterium]
MRTLIPALGLLMALTACPQPEPEPSIPDLSGSYNLSTTQRDSTCQPEDATPEQIFGFLDSTPEGIPVIGMELEQDGDSLDGTLTLSGCVWTGLVDTTGSFTLSGDCSDADAGRVGRIGATAEAFGDTWDVEGTLTIEVDTLDEAGAPGPDGTADCEVVSDLQGSGS